MSEEHSEVRPEERGGSPAEAGEVPPPTDLPGRPHRASWRAAPWLAALLTLVIAGIALSPFWAPDVAPLLPWSGKHVASAEDYAALEARLAAVEKRPVPANAEVEAIKSAQSAMARRVDQLEPAVNKRLAEIEKRTVPPGIDAEAINSAESALARRVDQLEAARNADRQTEATVAGTKAGLQQLDQRLGAIEAQSASRTASETGDLQNIQQELARLGKVTADMANRFPALERQVQSQAGAVRTDAALALVLLQMREAVEQARPFPAEYRTFEALARDPALAAAAQPLAEAAQNGVASRVVLSKRLAEIADQVATATEPPDESAWGAQALARLRGLVTIRRVGGAERTGPEAAMSAAQTALSRGDLAGAVGKLDTLTGANAEALRPWLRMARERLAVETALDHLHELLSARLGSSPAGPAAAPADAPAEPSGKAREPS